MGSSVNEILNPIIGEDLDDEMMRYLMRIRYEDDLEEFLSNIIDIDKPELKNVVEQLKEIVLGPDRRNWHPSTEAQKFEAIKNEQNNHYTSPSEGSKSKKTHYIALDTYTLTPALKKGRHPCDCEAHSHALVNNCLNCGRIVCEQEGSGPCFFCGNMVVTNQEEEILKSNSKGSDKLYNKLVDQKTSKEWKKAIEARDKLLKADRAGSANLRIYDDQADYFPINMERKSPQMKIALDLATKTSYEVRNDNLELNKKLLNNVKKYLDFRATQWDVIKRKSEEINNTNQLIEKDEQNGKEPSSHDSAKMLPKRVANQDVISHMDKGMCLSMHQPWASLLIAGIKKHEGRSWRTDHTGRLWIHAASKEPTEAEIMACEEFYKQYYNDPTLTFPKKYPVSCLLGCVFVDDCLPQKKYRELYPDGESDSPYVLICSNPIALGVFLPMSGQHKIFRMNRDLHFRAKECLLASISI